MEISCDFCGTKFHRAAKKVECSKRHFCTRECMGEAYKLPKEELARRKKERHAEWSKKNKEYKKAYNTQYRESHRDRINELGRLNYHENRDDRCERRKELYQEDIEHHRASARRRSREWALNRPERSLLSRLKCQDRTRITQRLLRERERALEYGCKVGDEEHLRAFYEQVSLIKSVLCCYCNRLCGSEIPGYSCDATIDHKVPISRGGSHDVENLCICCRECNSRKGPKTAEEYLQYFERVRDAIKGTELNISFLPSDLTFQADVVDCKHEQHNPSQSSCPRELD